MIGPWFDPISERRITPSPPPAPEPPVAINHMELMAQYVEEEKRKARAARIWDALVDVASCPGGPSRPQPEPTIRPVPTEDDQVAVGSWTSADAGEAIAGPRATAECDGNDARAGDADAVVTVGGFLIARDEFSSGFLLKGKDYDVWFESAEEAQRYLAWNTLRFTEA